jgi:MerR family transcriptional regulator, light-induced transcriptional regulator
MHVSSQDILIERLFESLIAGDRSAAREILADTLRSGTPVDLIFTDLFWPVYNKIETLYRQDQLSTLAHHYATRLLRMMVDQTAIRLDRRPDRGRCVLAFCGPTDPDELAAQMTVDLLEADGYEVRFAAGGIAEDEILGHVQQEQPDVLLLFASAPQDLPGTRWLIDKLIEIGACEKTQVVVGGGVYNRAEGLAEEIGADLWAETPQEVLQVMEEEPERRMSQDQRTVGRQKAAARASRKAA